MSTPVKHHQSENHSLTLRPGVEEETALLNKAIGWADQVASGIMAGSLKSSEGNVLLGAGRLVSSAAKQSIVNRTGRGRLLAQEAKMIEATA
jgi:hypothetical protein